MADNTTATSFSSGALNNKKTVSCVGVAGTGLPAAYYYVHGSINVIVTDMDDVYLQMTSLTVEQNDISDAEEDGSWGSDTWTFHGLYVSTKSFTLTDGPSGASGYGEGKQLWSSGHISHQGYGTGNASSHYSWLSSGSSTGLQRIGALEILEHNADYSEIYLYAGGLIDYKSSPTSSISIPSARITLKADQPIIEQNYYPWERMISNTWYSLNRNGPDSISAGLFRLSGSYQKCLNSDSGDNHGFRYSNGWKASPKSGQGA